MSAPASLADRIGAGDRRAISRAISAVENETAEAPAIRAALGDRARMTEHQADERVFIRSLAARGGA